VKPFNSPNPSLAEQVGKRLSMRTRKGEDQPRLLLFFFIAAAFSGLIAMIVVIVVMASTSTSKAVLADQESVGVYSGAVVRSLATITNLRYSDVETASCLGTSTAPGSFQRPVTLTMRFRTGNIPNRCDIFVNNVLVTTERRIEPEDCGTTCPFTEFNRQFSIGELDYRDNHQFRVCCDGICVDKTLERLCQR